MRSQGCSVLTEKMDNYKKMAEAARERFLTFSQEEIIRRWELEADEEWIFLPFFSQPCKIHRSDGKIFPESRCMVSDSMVIYDLLCHAKERPILAGSWESISSLGGIIGAGHDSLLSHTAEAEVLARNLQQVREACQRLGGVQASHADLSYIFPVTEWFPVWLQFWEADEEFPASIRFLWDANALQFMHYETLWYVMKSLLSRLGAE